MSCRVLILVIFVLIGLAGNSNADDVSDYYAVRTYAERGRAAEKKNDYETARRNFEAAVVRFPKSALAYWHRGAFFFDREQYRAALRDFNQAINLQPKVFMYTQWRGVTYAALGRCDLALADLNRILDLGTSEYTQVIILYNRALLLATCADPHYRNVGQAIKDAQFAVRFGDRQYRASRLHVLAIAYEQAGDFESAAKYEQEAIAAQTKDDQLKEANRTLDAYQQHRRYPAVYHFLLQHWGERI